MSGVIRKGIEHDKTLFSPHEDQPFFVFVLSGESAEDTLDLIGLRNIRHPPWSKESVH
jgi:hypothetical protein